MNADEFARLERAKAIVADLQRAIDNLNTGLEKAYAHDISVKIEADLRQQPKNGACSFYQLKFSAALMLTRVIS